MVYTVVVKEAIRAILIFFKKKNEVFVREKLMLLIIRLILIC